jgi:hypothetical protein
MVEGLRLTSVLESLSYVSNHPHGGLLDCGVGLGRSIVSLNSASRRFPRVLRAQVGNVTTPSNPFEKHNLPYDWTLLDAQSSLQDRQSRLLLKWVSQLDQGEWAIENSFSMAALADKQYSGGYTP